MAPIYRLDQIVVDPSRGCLHKDGGEIYLRPQTFQLLLYLVQRSQELVTKEELIQAIWQDTAVTDNALVQCIAEIRKSLDDSPQSPRFIKTVPRVGYRFIGPLQELSVDTAAVRQMTEVTSLELTIEEGSHPRPFFSGKRTWTIATTAALVVVLLFAWNFWPEQPPQAELSPLSAPGKKNIAVLYFENRSGAAEFDWLREGLADMLITDLSRSTSLSLLSRPQLSLLLERMGHDRSQPANLERALEIGRRSQADVVITGAFANLGKRMRIDAQIHQAGSGKLLAAESQVANSSDEILTRMGLLSLQLADHLDASRADQDRGLADVMTTDLEAYRYYSLGIERVQAYHTDEAIGLLKRALERDSDFAMAHAPLCQHE